MSQNIKNQLRDFFLSKLKDGMINPVLVPELLRDANKADHAVATKNKKSLVRAIEGICDTLLSSDRKD